MPPKLAIDRRRSRKTNVTMALESRFPNDDSDDEPANGSHDSNEVKEITSTHKKDKNHQRSRVNKKVPSTNDDEDSSSIEHESEVYDEPNLPRLNASKSKRNKLGKINPKRGKSQKKGRSSRSSKISKKGLKDQDPISEGDDDMESFKEEVDDIDEEYDDDVEGEKKKRPPTAKRGRRQPTSTKAALPIKAPPKEHGGSARKRKDYFNASTDSDVIKHESGSSHNFDEEFSINRKPFRARRDEKHFDEEQSDRGHSDDSRTPPSHGRQRRRTTASLQTYAEIDHSDIDEEEAEIGNTPPLSKRHTRTLSPQNDDNDDDDPDSVRRNTSPRVSNNRDSEERSVDEVVIRKITNKRTKQATSKRIAAGIGLRSGRVKAATSKHNELGDTEKEYLSPLNRRGTPSRRSAERASRILEAANKSTDDDNFDDIPFLHRRKSKKDDDEEEFYDEQGTDESDEEDEGLHTSYESEDREISKQNVRANVDEDEIFDAEESSGDEVTKPKATESPTLEIRPTKRKSYTHSSESEEDGERTSISRNIPNCSSTNDAITMLELPKRHVCFMPPDGQSRQCFSLETLHKIALSNAPCRDCEGKVTFKQPPHFRSVISDDLMDQIASRFGRSALDLDGEFYNRTIVTKSKDHSDDGVDEFGYMLNFDGTLADNSRFNELVDQYLNRYMGSKDIYCCPVCYAEAYRRLAFGKKRDFDPDDDSEGAVGDKNTEFRDHDPISVLGSLDDDTYQLASTFCFRKLAEVKRHIRDDHGLNTQEVEGSDLYKRFQIRAPDGLLQRHLDRRFKGQPKQGYMLVYWNMGNREVFIYLLHLLERSKLLRDEAKEHNADKHGFTEATEFVDNMQMFWDSFAGRAARMWELLSSPYNKETTGDIKEFFADDDEEVDEAPLLYRSVALGQDGSHGYTPEEEIVAALKAKRARRGELGDESDSDDDEDELSDADPVEEEELEVDDRSYDKVHPGYYSEIEEDEDEWMDARLNKRKPKGRTLKPLGNNVGAKKLGGRRTLSTSKSHVSTVVLANSEETVQPLNQKKRRIVESDDE